MSNVGKRFVSITVDDKELFEGLEGIDRWTKKGLKKATTEFNKKARARLDEATKTWSTENKPASTMKVTVGPSLLGAATQIMGVVEYWGTVFDFVDQGTKGPYPIPKPGNTSAKRLRFQSGYTKKTPAAPAFAARSGGPSGPFVTRRSVTHPGLKAANISGRIWKQLEKDALPMLNSVMDESLRGKW